MKECPQNSHQQVKDIIKKTKFIIFSNGDGTWGQVKHNYLNSACHWSILITEF
jgi:hypothetical protein